MKRIVSALLAIVVIGITTAANAYSLTHAETVALMSEGTARLADAAETYYAAMQSFLKNDIELSPIEISTFKQITKTYLDSGIVALQMSSGYYFHILKEASLTEAATAEMVMSTSETMTNALQRTADEAIARIDAAFEDRILTESEENSIQESMNMFISVVSVQVDTYLDGLS